MTRGQYMAMCAIGFIAVFALLQSVRLAERIEGGGIIPKNTAIAI